MRRLREFLAHPRAGWGLATLACLLHVPSLWTGLMVDDYSLLANAQGVPGIREPRAPLDLFAFVRPDDVPERMGRGILPWWTVPGFRMAFWRPLASATHWLDFSLWPGHPSIMHVQNLLWLVGLILVVTHLHRRLLATPWVAGLASLLYAIDDARALPAGWIANRNGLLAAVFALGSLALHLRWRREGSRSSCVMAPVLLLLGLLSNEGAVAVTAYLFAYAVFLDRGSIGRRLVTLAPYALVVAAWRVVYGLGDYGASGSGIYVDPTRSPLRFVTAVLHREPFLLLGQWALPPSDMFVLPFVPPSAVVLGWMFAVALFILVTVLLWPFLRKDRVSRFWYSSMLLCLVPSCAVATTDRMLLFAGLGATALLAQFLAAVRDGAHAPSSSLAGRFRRSSYWVLIGVHILVAPVLAVTAGQVFQSSWGQVEQAIYEAPLGECSEKTMAVVNPRHQLLTMYLPVLRGLNGQPVPRRMRSLGPTSALAAPIRAARLDDRTLAVRPEGGFPLLMHRDRSHLLTVGDRVDLPGMTVVIREMSSPGRPQEVAYVFDVPLEDDSLIWLQWRNAALEPFTPPAVGESVVIDDD